MTVYLRGVVRPNRRFHLAGSCKIPLKAPKKMLVQVVNAGVADALEGARGFESNPTFNC